MLRVFLLSCLLVVVAARPRSTLRDADVQYRNPIRGRHWIKHRRSNCARDLHFAKSADLSVASLMKECESTPECYGFSTSGMLKNARCDNHISEYSEHDLHTLADSPETDAWPPIWPMPQSFTNGTGSVTVAPNLEFQLSGSDPVVAAAIQRYQSLCFPHSTAAYPADVTKVTISVTTERVPLAPEVDESYTIDVSASAASITAATTWGALHALESFSQLISFDFDTLKYAIRGSPVVVRDAPRFPWRSVLVDSSRHFEPVATLKNLIDSLTYAKINVFHWHLTDDQAVPLTIPGFPDLGKGAWSPSQRYTLTDLQEIQDYAAARGIMVLPEYDTPSHAASWGVGYPATLPSPQCTSPINIASNVSFNLYEAVIDTSAKIFPLEYIHLGGDEVNLACWEKNPAIMKWLSDRKMSAMDGYLFWVKTGQAYARQRGKYSIGWNEVWEHFGTNLPPATIVQLWVGSPQIAQNITEHGYKMIWSVDGYWYLDGLSVSWQRMYDVEPCQYVSNAACDGKDRLVFGGEGCMWGETVDTSDIAQTIWPRLGAIAERLWGPKGTSSANALPRLQKFRCHLNFRGVAAAPVDNTVARTSPPHPGSCYSQ